MHLLPYIVIGLFALAAVLSLIFILLYTRVKRERLMSRVGKAIGFRLVEEDPGLEELFDTFKLLQTKTDARFSNLIIRTIEDTTIVIGDLICQGTGSSEKRLMHHTAVILRHPLLHLPHCLVNALGIADAGALTLTPGEQLEFTDDAQFSERFRAQAELADVGRDFLGPKLRKWFVDHHRGSPFSMESRGDTVVTLDDPGNAIAQYEDLLRRTTKLRSLLVSGKGTEAKGRKLPLEHRVALIAEQYSHMISDDQIFFAPGIPKRRLEGAWQSFVTSGSSEQEPLVLVDDTSLGSARNGLLLTDRRVFARSDNGEPVSFKIGELQGVEHSQKLHKQCLMVGDQKLVHVSLPGMEAMRTIAEMLNDIGKLVQAEEKGAD